MQLQLSVSTNTGLFNDFYPQVFQTPALPVLYMVQHAEVGEEDAHYFVTQVWPALRYSYVFESYALI